MFIPANIAQTEPLLDMDEDLVQLEEQAAQNPTAELLVNMATEYYSRVYLQRALFTSLELTRYAPENIEGWKLLANTQIDLAEDNQALATLNTLLALPGLDVADSAWAQALVSEITNRLNPGSAPMASVPATPPASPPVGDTFSGAPAVDSSLISDPLSALDMMGQEEPGNTAPVEKAPPTPQAPSSGKVGGVLEQQGIITQIATKDSGQLESVRLLLEKDPNNVELLDWYAFALYSSERLIESIEVYTRIIEDFEPTENAYYYLGSAYLKIPNLKRAFKYFDTLLKEFPNTKLKSKVLDKKTKLKALTGK